MAEYEGLILDVTREEREHIEALARQQGFDTPRDYILALVKADAEDEAVDLVEALRESLRDLREGRTYPIEKLRDMVDDDKD